MGKINIVAIGETLWDIFPNERTPGGAPANFAYHAAQQGMEAHIVSAVGNDLLGKELLTFLKSKNLSSKYIYVSDQYPTGTVQVSMTDGIPSYNITEHTAWDNIPCFDEMNALAAKADAACFGSLACRSKQSRETIFKFLEATHKDCLKVFDINLRQHYYTRELIEKAFEMTNILKLNDEEIKTVASCFELTGNTNEIISFLRDTYQFKAVILTKGAEGASYFSDEGVFSCKPAASEKPVSTVGCGDSFTATLISRLLYGDSPRSAMNSAEKVASFVSTQPGAMPELPVRSKKLS
jgi:fructokinase